jgi:hypothetical protein
MSDDNTIQKYDRIRGGMQGVALFTKPSTIRSCLGSALNGEATFSVSEYSALRAGIFKAWGLSIRWRLGGARTSSHAPVHRLDEPTGISLGMVASPQCPLPFRPAKSL